MPKARRVEWRATKAEGLCRGVPYDTDLVSSQGVNIHFWLNDREPTPQLLELLTQAAQRARDIVSVTYCQGDPTGYWANSEID